MYVLMYVCMYVCMYACMHEVPLGYTLRRHMGGGRRVLLGSERSTSHPGRLIPVTKKTIHTQQEAERAPDPGRRIRTRQTSLAPAAIRNSDRPALSLVTIATMLSQLLRYMQTFACLLTYSMGQSPS